MMLWQLVHNTELYKTVCNDDSSHPAAQTQCVVSLLQRK